MCHIGEDTESQKEKQRDFVELFQIYLYQDTVTHTVVLANEHTNNQKFLNLQHPKLHYPTTGMKYYHVLLQTIISGSVLQKKIFYISRTK
jgi:hypothetical protein